MAGDGGRYLLRAHGGDLARLRPLGDSNGLLAYAHRGGPIGIGQRRAHGAAVQAAQLLGDCDLGHLGGGGRWWEVVGGGGRWWKLCTVAQASVALGIRAEASNTRQGERLGLPEVSQHLLLGEGCCLGLGSGLG